MAPRDGWPSGGRHSVGPGSRWVWSLSEQAGLRGQQRLDTGTQTRPVGLRQVEMTAEVEQGHLADLLAGTQRGDEAVGEIGLAGRLVSGSGATDEHAPEAARGGGIPSMGFPEIMSPYDGF